MRIAIEEDSGQPEFRDQAEGEYRIQSNYSDTLDIAPNVPFNFVLALNMRQFQCLNIIFWRFDN